MFKIIIFIFLLFTPTITWYLLPSKNFNLMILNKTVHKTDFATHKGLFWFLNNKKLVKKDNSQYMFDKDYYGYYPGNNSFHIKSIPNKIENYDLVYIADTYGIYQNDLRKMQQYPNKLVYGGLSEAESNTIIAATQKNKKVIVEFNTIETIGNKVIKAKLTDILGIKSTGWVAKYFIELNKEKNKEIPEWAIRNYEKKYNKQWLFNRGGIIFAHENEKDIDVIPDLLNKSLEFNFTEQGKKVYGLSNKAYYYDWFNIVEANHNSQVLAEFNLKSYTDSIDHNCDLKKFNNVPAIVYNPLNKAKTFYFSGEFSKIESSPSIYQFSGMDNIKRIFISEKSKDSFFWEIFSQIILN